MNRRHFLKLTGSASLVSFTGAAPSFADTPFPSRMVTIVTGVAAGGQADLAARPVAQGLSQVFDKTVIVDNRTGAGGALGAAYVLKSEPDGHTMFMALSAAVVLPEADRIAGRKPLYEMSSFAPVARVLGDPNLLAVSADSKYQTVADVIKDARARPGEISYSSSGNYGGVHISMEMFAQAAGIKLLHVPYRGGAPALTALMGDQVGMTALGSGPLKSYADAGKLRVLATFGAQRHPAFPDAPTFKESGLDNVVFNAWVGLFLPKGVPPEVMERTRVAMKQVMTDPEILSIFAKAGSPAAYMDTPEFTQYVAEDTERLVKVVQAIGKLE
ncbi:MAG TPA: tripartite tricarboxylate transporter substrate binding protein [Pseudolabrys sp.]